MLHASFLLSIACIKSFVWEYALARLVLVSMGQDTKLCTNKTLSLLSGTKTKGNRQQGATEHRPLSVGRSLAGLHPPLYLLCTLHSFLSFQKPNSSFSFLQSAIMPLLVHLSPKFLLHIHTLTTHSSEPSIALLSSKEALKKVQFPKNSIYISI